MIKHLETRRLPIYERDEEIHKDFYGSKKTNQLITSPIPNQKTVLLWRPVHERILSGYLDKYVNKNSPTPKLGTPACETFEEFVNLLSETKLDRALLYEKKIDEGLFGSIKDSLGLAQFKKLNKSQFTKTIQTPLTAFPEAKIILPRKQIKETYDLLHCSLLYEEIDHKFSCDPGSLKIWEYYKDKINFSNKPAYNMTKEQLQEYQNPARSRTIPFINFYNERLWEAINKTYTDEIKFLEKYTG